MTDETIAASGQYGHTAGHNQWLDRGPVECVSGMWRLCGLSALWRENLRGLQGFLQAVRAEEHQVRVFGLNELYR